MSIDLSFGVGEQSGQYEVTVFVHNLLDQNYANNKATFVDATGQSDNVIQFVSKSAGRYLSASFKYNF